MSFIIHAIDPGPEQSALVIYDPINGGHVVNHLTLPNSVLLQRISDRARTSNEHLVIEQVASFGMPVGAEVFETVFWSGRFAQSWTGYRPPLMPWHRVTRGAVKVHLCGSMRAKDANIRQAILDRFGGRTAIGLKKSQGPLYGVKAHEFAALAVALTYADAKIGPTNKGLKTAAARKKIAPQPKPKAAKKRKATK